MKRSEMLNVLLGSIYENIGCYDGLGLVTDDYAKILDDLEKAGMLPPDNGKEAYDLMDYRSKCLKWDKEHE